MNKQRYIEVNVTINGETFSDAVFASNEQEALIVAYWNWEAAEKVIVTDYQCYVLEVFKEDHAAKGMDLEEIEDIIQESDFSQIERWLKRQGYELLEMYRNDFE